MSEISPDRFLFENAGICCGFSVADFIEQDDKGNARRINKDKYKLIGWCDSSKLNVRPRERQIALLFDVLDEKIIVDRVWIHAPIIFKKLFEIRDD